MKMQNKHQKIFQNKFKFTKIYKTKTKFQKKIQKSNLILKNIWSPKKFQNPTKISKIVKNFKVYKINCISNIPKSCKK